MDGRSFNDNPINKAAEYSMICSVAGLVSLFLFSVLLGFGLLIVGIILGIIALIDIKTNPAQKGVGFAVIGILISVIYFIYILFSISIIADNKITADRTLFEDPLRSEDYFTYVNETAGTIEVYFLSQSLNPITLPLTGTLTNEGKYCSDLKITGNRLSTIYDVMYPLQPASKIELAQDFSLTWICPEIISTVKGKTLDLELSFDYIDNVTGEKYNHNGTVHYNLE